MFEAFHALMMTYAFVSSRRNPLLKMKGVNPATLSYGLVQYAWFPRVIVTMLMAIRDLARQYGWEAVAQELTRNLGEELGTETYGVPHNVLFTRILEEECGLDSPMEKSASTSKFISGMFHQLLSGDRIHALGTVYALETTACPELLVVVKMITHLRKQKGHKNPGAFSPNTQNFFDMHINIWEPGHSEGLRLASEPLLTSDDARTSFEHGFKAVLDIMETWWEELADETSRLGQMSH